MFLNLNQFFFSNINISMVQGFISNYNDSGYTVGTGTYYNNTNTQITSNISSQDIYAATKSAGVYMLNGTTGSATTYTVFSSISSTYNLNSIGIPNSADDAWIVYPGYGFQLHGSGVDSRIYMNTTTSVQFYSFNGGGFSSKGCTIYDTNNNMMSPNRTLYVDVYFRFYALPSIL